MLNYFIVLQKRNRTGGRDGQLNQIHLEANTIASKGRAASHLMNILLPIFLIMSLEASLSCGKIVSSPEIMGLQLPKFQQVAILSNWKVSDLSRRQQRWIGLSISIPLILSISLVHFCICKFSFSYSFTGLLTSFF